MLFADWFPPTGKMIETFASCNIGDVILGVSTSRQGFKLNYTEKAWVDAAKEIKNQGMGVHYMAWSVPHPVAMREILEGMNRLSNKCKAVALWHNAESTWHNGSVSGVQAAINEIVEFKSEHKGRPLMAVVGLDRLHHKVALLGDVCDWVCPEAYSFWNPEEGHWSQTPWTFPGVQQRRAYDTWIKKFPHKGLVMGMACYYEARPASGVFPGCTAAQSRRWAMSEVVAIRDEMKEQDQSFVGTAYWSGKFVDGSSIAEQDRRSFFRKAAKL